MARHASSWSARQALARFVLRSSSIGGTLNGLATAEIRTRTDLLRYCPMFARSSASPSVERDERGPGRCTVARSSEERGRALRIQLRFQPLPHACSRAKAESSGIHAVLAREHLQEGWKARRVAGVLLGAAILGRAGSRRGRTPRARSVHPLSRSQGGTRPDMRAVAGPQLTSGDARRCRQDVQLVQLESSVARAVWSRGCPSLRLALRGERNLHLGAHPSAALCPRRSVAAFHPARTRGHRDTREEGTPAGAGSRRGPRAKPTAPSRPSETFTAPLVPCSVCEAADAVHPRLSCIPRCFRPGVSAVAKGRSLGGLPRTGLQTVVPAAACPHLPSRDRIARESQLLEATAPLKVRPKVSPPKVSDTS